eukprot:scaffold86404_cov19-Tisochrysis_lutea.AAC.1
MHAGTGMEQRKAAIGQTTATLSAVGQGLSRLGESTATTAAHLLSLYYTAVSEPGFEEPRHLGTEVHSKQCSQDTRGAASVQLTLGAHNNYNATNQLRCGILVTTIHLHRTPA